MAQSFLHIQIYFVNIILYKFVRDLIACYLYLGYNFPERNESDAMFSALKVMMIYYVFYNNQ